MRTYMDAVPHYPSIQENAIEVSKLFLQHSIIFFIIFVLEGRSINSTKSSVYSLKNFKEKFIMIKYLIFLLFELRS